MFLYYTFLLYSILCYVFATLSVRFYNNNVKPLTVWKAQTSKIPIFILAYSNLSAINLNADGGTWADSIILILIAISIMLILDNHKTLSSFFIVSGFMILTYLLDPDYVPMFIVAILILSITTGLANKNLLRNIARSMIPIATSIMPLVFLYFQASFTGAVTTSGFTNLGYRDFTPGTVAYFSTNINPFNVLVLLGHQWATLTYAPPSILFFPLKIPFMFSVYHPSQVLLPNDFLTVLWIISLISIPVLAFSSLIFKNVRRYALMILPIFIIAYLITQEWNLNVIYYSLRPLTEIPFLGVAIGTALSLPGHFINLIAFSYLPMFALTVISIVNLADKFSLSEIAVKSKKIAPFKRKKSFNKVQSKKRNAKPLIAILIIVFLVTLSGWQAFNGSIYPMRSYPGSYLVGNAVEPKGALSPTAVNDSVINAYRIVTSNYSLGNYSSEYNTLWIGGPTANDFPYMDPPLSVSVSGIKSLKDNGLYSDVFPYLESHGIRYVVVSGDNIQPNMTNPFIQYGFSGYNQATSFFKNSGLKEIYNENETSVFLTSNVVNMFYKSNILLNTAQSDVMSPALYELFHSLGYNASLTGSGTPTGFNNNSKSIDIVTPALMPFSHIFNMKGGKLNYTLGQGQYKYLNSSEYPGSLNYYQNNSLGQYTDYLPGNVTTTAWGGNTSFSYHNGSVSASATNASISIGYNDALAGQVGGVKILNSTSPVGINLKFSIFGSIDFRANSYVTLLGESSNVSVSTFFQNHPFNVNNKQHEVNIAANLPAGTTYVGFRIELYTFTGQVTVNNINFSISSAYSDSHTPFGSYLNVSNVTFTVPAGKLAAIFTSCCLLFTLKG